jgi:hypothetical protein
MADTDDTTHLNEVILARVAAGMGKSRMTASARRTLGAFAANSLFRPDECVYNRDTKEHGQVKHAYEKDGVTMYKVWLPAPPEVFGWGHFVSDWAEGVLELSRKILLESAWV